MTEVFISDVLKLNSDISVYKNMVSEYRYKKVLTYKNEMDRMLSLGAELLLAEYLGRIPDYKIDEFGKPYGECVEFNFSHSGSVAVCAVSDSAVGVDIEKLRYVNLDIAKKKFCESEYNVIINSKNPQNTFFEYWVKKESYVKALGKGMRIPFNSFNTDEITDRQFEVQRLNEYVMCVCKKDKSL